MAEIKHWDGPPLDAWQPWRPQQAAIRLAGLNVDWCVVGGWAIDLWLGEETRPHDDLEIAIVRSDFSAVRDHLAPLPLYVVGDGEVRKLAAGALPPPDKHQNWVLDAAANAWRMDVMIEPGDAKTWIFRRDETIRAERAAMIDRRDGVPFLKPHGALLYKAKAKRLKDDADFAACAPRLDDVARSWLRTALETVHPGHAWLNTL